MKGEMWISSWWELGVWGVLEPTSYLVYDWRKSRILGRSEVASYALSKRQHHPCQIWGLLISYSCHWIASLQTLSTTCWLSWYLSRYSKNIHDIGITIQTEATPSMRKHMQCKFSLETIMRVQNEKEQDLYPGTLIGINPPHLFFCKHQMNLVVPHCGLLNLNVFQLCP